MCQLSLIIPAYNEAERIEKTLVSSENFLEVNHFDYEIIVVDDGSTDRTVEVVESRAKLNSSIRILRVPTNKGKGHAVKTGMLAAKGKLCVFTDADGSTPIEELEELIRPISTGETLISIGSRYLQNSVIHIEQPWYRRKWSRISNRIIQKTLLPGIIDPHCGFKAFEFETAQLLFSRSQVNGWAFDLEILALARKFAIPIQEFAVHWCNDERSKGRLSDLPKEIVNVFKIKRRLKSIA